MIGNQGFPSRGSSAAGGDEVVFNPRKAPRFSAYHLIRRLTPPYTLHFVSLLRCRRASGRASPSLPPRRGRLFDMNFLCRRYLIRLRYTAAWALKCPVIQSMIGNQGFPSRGSSAAGGDEVVFHPLKAIAFLRPTSSDGLRRRIHSTSFRCRGAVARQVARRHLFPSKG